MRKLTGFLLALCAFVIGLALLVQLDRSSAAPTGTQTTSKQIADAPNAPDEADSPHSIRLKPNVFTGSALSDGRTYSVSLIDANKNKIPTGTELFVQGTLLSTQWTQDSACSWFLVRGRANVQHGDNPEAYCRFSILLTEKRKDGGDMWPAAALVCDVTPEEMKEVTHLYHYGDEVQAHGSYAASLDFTAVPGLGGHFGVPLLKGCSFADPTDNVVRPKGSTREEPKPDVPPQSLASAPQLISKVPAEYSMEARAAKLNGTVTVSFVLDAQGTPKNLHVTKPLGMGLDEAALTAVSKYRFEPAHDANGIPVSVPVNVDVAFQIY